MDEFYIIDSTNFSAPSGSDIGFDATKLTLMEYEINPQIHHEINSAFPASLPDNPQTLGRSAHIDCRSFGNLFGTVFLRKAVQLAKPPGKRLAVGLYVDVRRSGLHREDLHILIILPRS
ncbi:hypothetical protein FRC01_003105 [Tulasnella sp. 417]|nr:hypothetical protein FRC01_003105 [Tulasnella sp. 417]